MKRVLISALVLALPAVLTAQDPVKVDPGHYKLVSETAAVRILRVSIGPGEKTPMHSHPDTVVIPLSAAKTRFTMPGGKSEDVDMANESALYMPAGSHSGTSLSTGKGEVIVVEFKTATPGKATLPASRVGMTMKILAEGPRAMAYRSTAGPTFQEPAGSKHDYDQVVIALGPVQMSLSLDGKPAKTNWTRGEAVFIPRGTAHESKNNSGKPVDFIIVAIK